jgi:hypothetical protein
MRSAIFGFLFSLLFIQGSVTSAWAADQVAAPAGLVAVAPAVLVSAAPAVQMLVTMETKANAAALRSNKVVNIENYEIPYELVKTLLSPRLDPRILHSLIFVKNGEKYVRWMINPEDTTWHQEVEKFLTSRGVSTEHHQYFKGYQTASRSYIVLDPVSGAQFSLKVSTDHTGGAWKDKKQTFDDARQIRLMDDYVSDVFAKFPPKHLVYMSEPAVFGLEDIDQGMIVRSLNDLSSPTVTHYYLPGFSVLHDDVGRAIARRNGSDDPQAYWNQNYNLPLARALAELAARTGVVYDSPHSQNFLVEFDRDMKPTGRIVLRDLGDVYVSREFVTAMGRPDVAAFFEHDNVMDHVIPMAVGVLHGNTNPTWMSERLYQSWGREFFREFNKTFAETAGIQPTEIPYSVSQNGKYFSEPISTQSTAFMRLFKNLHQSLAYKVSKLRCQTIFQY